MKKGKNVSFLFFAFALVCLLNACVPAVSMKHEMLTKGDMKRGAVVVGTISNQRADENGGESFETLGKVRNAYGNPFDLKAESGRDIDVLLREVVMASLEHVGYSSDQAAGEFFRLDIDVLKFWCDGYMGYKIESELAVKLINSTNGKILAQKSINVQKGFPLGFGTYNPMYNAFNEVINDIQKELVVFMKSERFQTAAKR
jgi:hypothetical protein